MRRAAVAVALLVAAQAAAQGLPSLRVPIMEPSLLPPQWTVYDWHVYNDDDNGWTTWQDGLVWASPRPVTAVTFLAWTRLDNASSYAACQPFIAPLEASGKAPCTTFLGPESGTGDKTWTGVCQPAPAGYDGYIAFNLTCSASTTVKTVAEPLDNSGRAVTVEAGEHLGLALRASPEDDLILTTTGTWTIEVATPKTVRCYTFDGSRDNSGQTVLANVFADAWGLSVCTFTVADGKIVRSSRTYYPDGCIEPKSQGTKTVPLGEGLDAIPPARFSPFCMYFFQWVKFDETLKRPVSVYRAFGPKAFARVLSEGEIQNILKRDAAEMVRRGYLTEADVNPAEDPHTVTNAVRSLTIRAKAAAPKHTHSPGPDPVFPPFPNEEATP